MKKLFTMLSVAAALLTGCSDDPDVQPPKPELKITSADASVSVDADGLGAAVAAGAEGLTVAIGIETNLEAWTLGESVPAWIETDRSATSLSLRVLPNDKVEARNAALTVTVGNTQGKLEATIRVAQTGVAAATLTLDEKSVALPPAGGSASVAYTSNQPAITVQKTADWLSFDQRDGAIEFSADANDSGEPRTTEVTLVAGAGDNTASETVVVSQDTHITLTISEKTVALPPAGGTVAITYTSNQPTVAVQKAEAWLTFTQGEGSIEFSADANGTGAPRSSEVTVTAGTGENAVSEKVVVSQAPFIKTLSYVVRTTAAGQEVPLPMLSTNDASIGITVNFGDDSALTNFTAALSTADKHTYAEAGEYTVTITTDNAISSFQFAANTYLHKIANNSLDMSAVTTLARCFYNCTGLTEVAVNTLAPCVNATSADYLFYNCKALAALPSGLLGGLTKLASFNNMCQNCSALTTIPEGLFAGNTAVSVFNNTFSGAGLTSVPARLFAGCSGVTRFGYTFYKCSNLASIAVDAFEGCTAVKEFYATFTECTTLTEIPATLFSGMRGLNDLEYSFQGCSGLRSLPATLFDNNRSLKFFEYCFMNCTSLTGESPYTVIGDAKVHLYERKNYPDDFLSPSSYDGCFRNDEGLSDYAALMQNGWAN